jgi:diaminohydroxyphosphoribosylaminopyrimidine deaminase / 5-amino-6-(5-phosphoribosylamino)uracil reductase
MNTHEIYMQRCLELAKLGLADVAPNPMVGSVLVHEDRIIGEGYHQKFGEAHAEVNCINSVAQTDVKYIPDSTLYVSLEPCNHFGKTPPCTDLIIEKKIPRVVIGCKDSFEKVNGTGIDRLRENGIEVLETVLEKDCLELNKRFFTYHLRQRPYIILKWAQSANEQIGIKGQGRVAISNESTNKLVHKWRSEEAAILVGTETARLDNPRLDTRLWPGKNPLRVVIDERLTLPSSLHLFDQTIPTLVINTVKFEEKENCSLYKTSSTDNLLGVILHLLFQRKINSLIVEGGAETIQSFIKQGLWDEARVITNTGMQIENGVKAPLLDKFILSDTYNVDSDEISVYRNTDQSLI